MSLVVAVLSLGAAVGDASAPRSAPRCVATQLGVWAGPTNGAAGTLLSEFAFVNMSSKTCSLIGYPKLQMTTSSGHVIATIDDKTSPGFDGITKRLVILATGKRAYFGAAYADHDSGTVCPTSAELVLTPPGSFQGLTLKGAGAQITPYSGKPGVSCGVVQLTPVTAKNFNK